MSQNAAISDRARAKLSRAWFLGSKRVYQRAAVMIAGAQPAERIVFVAGAQRSGTNMVMDMLERSFQTEVLHERDPRAFENFELRGQDVLRSIIASSRAPAVVFKALCESQYLASLLAEYAKSKGVWVYRSYEPVVRSHVRLWTGMPETMRLIATDPQATHGWRGRGMSAHTRDLVRTCYHDSISNESACALFWYVRNVLFFEQALEQSDRVCLLSYDRLVNQPESNASQLFQFLGLQFSPKVCDFVAPTVAARSRGDDMAIDAPIRAACDDLFAKLEHVVETRA